jgi:quinol monooxygenase YgiN
MTKHALFVRFEANPGKEKELAQFLQTGLGMAQHDATASVWFALQLGPSTFGIFDAFRDETGCQAHLNGPSRRPWGQTLPSGWPRRRRSNASTRSVPSWPAEARSKANISAK